MSAELVAVIAVILVAMAFDFTNGFHDAANAIATSVSTRALTPNVALLIAAIGNFVGAHFGAKVAKTVGSGLVTLPPGMASLGVVFAGVIGAIGWNLLTWYRGLPSSSSHALFGGLIGATLFASGGTVQWGNIYDKVIVPMVASPVVGLIVGALFMLVLLWSIKGLSVYAVARVATRPDSRLTRVAERVVAPGLLNKVFRGLQAVSATAMAFGHGMQDAAKTMGIVVLALYTGGFQSNTSHIPGWVYYTSAGMLALGTYSGGWRIIRTLGRRIIDLGPIEGFAAEATASSVLFYTASIGAPISTTQSITAAIMGVGATKRASAVRWVVAGNIVTAWVLTLPGAGLLAALTYAVVQFAF